MEFDIKNFKDNYFFQNRGQKEYLLKKININEHPKIKKTLNTFFNDTNKYFEDSYDNKHIIVGKKYTSKNRKGIINPYDNINNKAKPKNKKLFKRMTLKNCASLKTENEKSYKAQNKDAIKEEKNTLGLYTEESQLKPGQRFITDKEIDNIFSLFREVRRINKNKFNNFMTLKKLNEINNKNNIFKYRIKSRNFTNNLINIKSSFNQENTNSPDSKGTKKSKKDEILVNKSNKLEKDNIDIDYYNTTSTGFTGSFKDEISIKNNYMSMDLNTGTKNKFKDIIEREVKLRKKLLKRQEQYIDKNIDKSIKNEFSNILSHQEKTFISQDKNKNIQSKLNQYISSKIKKSHKSNLLLLEDSYRPNLEIKLKLNNIQKQLNPEKLYNWYKDLHSSEKIFVAKKHLPIVETIRTPKNIKYYSPTPKTLEKNEYLKKTIPKKMLKNLFNDEKNFSSLQVKGVNLLRLENDIYKKLKGRKIMNDFERIMSPLEKKCKNFLSRIDKNIFFQKTKSSFWFSNSS